MLERAIVPLPLPPVPIRWSATSDPEAVAPKNAADGSEGLRSGTSSVPCRLAIRFASALKLGAEVSGGVVAPGGWCAAAVSLLAAVEVARVG